ncbi:nucleotidyltransferase family protein, partial [Photobacterium sp. OFAV2-7]|uniref:nucleotidyltransferase family protein n=1 Tax=Photobacterium sp. OFAV2-7 TaxID=2917748 RepID=UPI00351D6BD8
MSRFEEKTSQLLVGDELRMACLEAARTLKLPDWYLGAGFLRNAIWDHLHGKTSMTPLNDVDVVYFDAEDTSLR